jgi:transposase-like protein
MNAPVIESKKTRKKFNKAFKQQAVELWLHSGKPATEVAAELGIHAQRLSAWKKRLGPPPQGGKGAAAPSAASNNGRPNMPVCGARTTICASSGTF